MLATLVLIDVKPESVEEFIRITEYNHENSRKEPGNVRFDFLRNNKEPNHFVLYEVYQDEASAAAHIRPMEPPP